MWHAVTGVEVRTLIGHAATVWSACFSPDGKRVLSGGKDGTLILWDVNTGSELHNWKGHTDDVWVGEFTPDGKRAVSIGKDKAIKIWNAENGSILGSITPETAPYCLVLHRNLMLVGNVDTTLTLYHIK